MAIVIGPYPAFLEHRTALLPLLVFVLVLFAGARPALAQGGAPAAHVETLDEYSPAVITVSRAGDALGAPIVLRSSKPPIDEDDGKGGLAMPSILPVASVNLTSRFGIRSHPILGNLRMHSGIDLAAPAGTPVRASKAGVVTYANWRGGYGLFVSVSHSGGMVTQYAHMSKLYVGPGQHVSKGEVVGLVGSTGLSTGPHLHYEVLMNGRAVDPLRR